MSAPSKLPEELVVGDRLSCSDGTSVTVGTVLTAQDGPDTYVGVDTVEPGARLFMEPGVPVLLA